ncbi:MAG: shikimate dehydrogenase [Methylotenera sp.]|nr:shikimate dehydrogenase [Methylotenera sp.]
MTDKYAVIGNPIAHSKSPLIHEAFAKQTNQDMSYERILVPLDGFEDKVRDLIEKGYKGINVTVPFKFEALKFVFANGVLNPLADRARAVNTILLNPNLIGDNTDGIGLVNDVTKNFEFSIRNKKVLVLGSGGAAFGVLQPLVNQNPMKLTISNRDFAKAEVAVQLLSELIETSQCTTICEAIKFEDLEGCEFDLVINATSIGLTDAALPIPNTIFAKGCLAYDMMYGRVTPFMKQAKENGAQVADGLGMLVEQAAEAFYLWRGVRPKTQSVIQEIRNLA